MIRVPRWSVAILSMLYAAYHFWLAVMSFESYTNYSMVWIAIGIYVATIVPSILLYRGRRMPTPQAIANLVAACVIPLLVNSQLQIWSTNVYSTWYVGAIGTLMAATAIRQQNLVAWIGVSMLVIQVVIWAGLDSFFKMGLPGAFLLVFAAHTISLGMQTTSKDIIAFTREKLAIESRQVAISAARAERQNRIESALLGAMPMLQLIANQKGELSAPEKTEAKLLESSLRDEIRGRALITPSLKKAVRTLRELGVEVIVLDEGGLDGTAESERISMIEKVVSAIAAVDCGRVTIRAPKGEAWKVSVAATRPGVATPDIWLKL